MLFITSALSDRCTVYFHHDPQLRRGHMLECNTWYRIETYHSATLVMKFTHNFMASVAMCCVSSQSQVLHSNLWWSKMVNLTKTRNFKGSLDSLGQIESKNIVLRSTTWPWFLTFHTLSMSRKPNPSFTLRWCSCRIRSMCSIEGVWIEIHSLFS